MRNPLKKRVFREIRMDWGKYLAVFVFLVLTIGFVSGGVVAGESMQKAYNDSFQTYKIEDGHFDLYEQADESLIQTLEQEDSMSMITNIWSRTFT